jgi:hypothetical protein
MFLLAAVEMRRCPFMRETIRYLTQELSVGLCVSFSGSASMT